jgi:hypothetical protein
MQKNNNLVIQADNSVYYSVIVFIFSHDFISGEILRNCVSKLDPCFLKGKDVHYNGIFYCWFHMSHYGEFKVKSSVNNSLSKDQYSH